ncbi:unnamed protein product [Symbiodinium sp. CCMP2592]|nr:unnamed protein product [Symbiodinium sp. CCMP2592]
MTPDLKLLVESCLQERGLWWAAQPTAATHVKGGILDFLWCERDNAKPPPIFHDGQVCRSRGCHNPLCGNIADATASKDLDHYAWTFATCLTKLPGAETAFSLYFSKDADMWECAVHAMCEKVMELLALDQSTALQSCQAWPWLTSKQRKCALNACAGLWDVLMTMVGYSAGLVMLRPLTRSPTVPQAVKQAFHAMVRAAKLKPHDATVAEVLHMKRAAQSDYRQQVALHRVKAIELRCNRYLQLCTSKDPQADAFLSKCLKKNPSGLPDNMVNDEGEDQQDNVLIQVRSAMRTKVNGSLPLASPEISPELLSSALQGIDPSAECRGLPYAALLVPNPAHVSWIHSLHSLMHAFAVSPLAWTKQSLYHSLKPGRPPNSFMSYRVLGLNTAQGRLQEELFIQLEPDLWCHTGKFQEGRQECLIVVAADLCIASIRLELGLPFGLCLNDRKEAFDTQWRSSMLINLASGVSSPRSWCLADELLRTTSMSVVKSGARSRSFSSLVGVVQGRKLSPLEFCIGQQNLEEHAARNMVGIGINPPVSAVEAYHQRKDGHSADVLYDLDEPRRLHELVSDGILTWSEAFSRASSDTCRLILLDLAAPTKRSIRSFMDDTRIPVASHGHARRAVNLLQDVAALEQYMYKPSKCSIVASGFSQRAPVMLQGQKVNYCNEAVQLGISLDTRFDGAAHLQLIMSRGPGRMKCLLAELINLGMPMQALLTSMRTRMTPAATFGIELVVQVPYADKHLNALQAKWLRTALGCYSVPRIVMMAELGIQDRLSATAWARALMLRRRGRLDPRYAQEEEIFKLAESCPSSWASAVKTKEIELKLPLVPQGCDDVSIKQLKSKLHSHARTVVLPAIRDNERRMWFDNPKNLQHWKSFSPDAWRVASLSWWGIMIKDAQAWAQLKLQGYFSRQDGHAGPSVPCSFCNEDVLETTDHLFLSCPRVHALLHAVLHSACRETKLSVGSKLAHAEDVLQWVYAAGKLLRSKHERSC